MKDYKNRKINDTGKKYNNIIKMDGDVIVPSRVYLYQIEKRNNFIRNLLKNKEIKTSLDLGCGTGFHSTTIDRFTNGTIILSDISEEALKSAKKLKFRNKAIFIVSDARHIKPGKELDFAYIGILHHIPDDIGECINSLSQYMKKGSCILIDEPNKTNLINHVNIMVSRADPVGNERPLSHKEVSSTLESSGFSVKQTEFYGFVAPIAIFFMDNRNVVRVAEFIESIFSKTFLRNLFFRWRIVAVKR